MDCSKVVEHIAWEKYYYYTRYEWYESMESEKYSEDFIENFLDKLDLYMIFKNQKLSEKFILKYLEELLDTSNIEFSDIFKLQPNIFSLDVLDTVANALSKDMRSFTISKYNYQVNIFNKKTYAFSFGIWQNFAKFQTLTEEFVERYIKDFQWAEVGYDLIIHQKFSKEFYKKHSWINQQFEKYCRFYGKY